jgi:hypothetical protein
VVGFGVTVEIWTVGMGWGAVEVGGETTVCVDVVWIVVNVVGSG